MRRASLVLIALLGCSTKGSDASAPSGFDSSSCKVGPPNVRFDNPACLEAKCNAEATSCWGAQWRANRIDSVCRPAVECSCKCAVGDVACLLPCVDKLDSACKSCIDAADVCYNAKCRPSADTGADTDASPTTGCAALALCCPKLPVGPVRDQCEAAVDAKDEAKCQTTLDFNRGSGSC